MSVAERQQLNATFNGIIEAFYNDTSAPDGGDNGNGIPFVQLELRRLRDMVDAALTALDPPPLPPKDKEEAEPEPEEVVEVVEQLENNEDDAVNGVGVHLLHLGSSGEVSDGDDGVVTPALVLCVVDVVLLHYDLDCVTHYRLSETGVLTLEGHKKDWFVTVVVDLKTRRSYSSNTHATTTKLAYDDAGVSLVDPMTTPVAERCQAVLRFVRAIARDQDTNPLDKAALERIMDPRLVPMAEATSAWDSAYRFEMRLTLDTFRYCMLVVTRDCIVLNVPKTSGFVNMDTPQERYVIGPSGHGEGHAWDLRFLFPPALALAPTAVAVSSAMVPEDDEDDEDDDEEDDDVASDSFIDDNDNVVDEDSFDPEEDEDDDEDSAPLDKKRPRSNSSPPLSPLLSPPRRQTRSHAKRVVHDPTLDSDHEDADIDLAVVRGDDDPDEMEQEVDTETADLRAFIRSLASPSASAANGEAKEFSVLLARGYARSEWARRQFSDQLDVVRSGCGYQTKQQGAVFDMLLDYDGAKRYTCVTHGGKPCPRTPTEEKADKAAGRESRPPQRKDVRRCVMCNGHHPCADTLWIRGEAMPVGTYCARLAEELLNFIDALQKMAAAGAAAVTAADTADIKRRFKRVLDAHHDKSKNN